MKSCLDCKQAEETLFDEVRKCTNEKSGYCGMLVTEKDLCRYMFEDEEDSDE